MVNKIGIIGLQAGDEGKGMRVAYFVDKASKIASERGEKVWVMRYQGGANAGHKIRSGETIYKFHQVPSGIIFPNTFNLIGEGAFVNPIYLMEEIKRLQESGVQINSQNFGIASNAHVTLSYHIEMDEQDRKRPDYTSTGKGIKPTAKDKASRTGIRFQEFLNPNLLEKLIKDRPYDEKKIVNSYRESIDFLSGFSILQSDILSRKNFSHGIFEGAQGFRLDVDRGLYPGVTFSNPSIIPLKVDTILGVVKFYESSIGHDRPFVGRMDRILEEFLREGWEENGTTTGLPRDLGWFDALAVKHAAESSETDFLVSSCGDRMEVLAQKGIKPKIVVAYEIDGKKYSSWDVSFHNRETLYRAKPIFEEFEPWEKFTNENGELSENARIFTERIEELVGMEFVLHGAGPAFNQVVELTDIINNSSSQKI